MDLVRLRLAELAKLLQRPMTRDEFYQASRRLIGMHIGTRNATCAHIWNSW